MSRERLDPTVCMSMYYEKYPSRYVEDPLLIRGSQDEEPLMTSPLHQEREQKDQAYTYEPWQ